MISAADFDTLRSIARAGQDYAAVKELLATTQWKIEEDNTDLGFLRVFITYDSDKQYRLIIGYGDPERPPYSLLTFGLFPDSEEHLAAFNSAFHSAAESIAQYIGAPAVSGERQPSFRTWSYARYRWSLPEGRIHAGSRRIRYSGGHGCHTLDSGCWHAARADFEPMTHVLGTSYHVINQNGSTKDAETDMHRRSSALFFRRRK